MLILYSTDAQVGQVKFSSSSNMLAQRNVVKFNDKQNNLKWKFHAACAGEYEKIQLWPKESKKEMV